MKVNYKYLFFGAVIVLILYIVFSPTGRENDDLVKTLGDRIEVINKEKDFLREAALRMSIMNQSYRDSIRILKDNYIEIEDQRDDLKRNYEERINNIDDMSIVELDSFFSDRYGNVSSKVNSN